MSQAPVPPPAWARPQHGRILSSIDPPATYYLHPRGQLYRLSDCIVTEGGRLVVLPLGDHRATARIFRPMAGPAMVYERRSLRDLMELTAATCFAEIEVAVVRPSRRATGPRNGTTTPDRPSLEEEEARMRSRPVPRRKR